MFFDHHANLTGLCIPMWTHNGQRVIAAYYND